MGDMIVDAAIAPSSCFFIGYSLASEWMRLFQRRLYCAELFQ